MTPVNLNGFKDPSTLLALSQAISKEASKLSAALHIMEVCGGHTHTIMHAGLSQLLPPHITLVHGPGCPVCVMPKERIDQAIQLARMKDVLLVTLGDMIRVPGSLGTLGLARAQGANVVAIYSPKELLSIAQQHPEKMVVFFAIGFETTTPMTAALIDAVIKQNISNVRFHINHVLIPPAIDAIMQDPQARIHALLAPSHVSVIQGAQYYQAMPSKYGVPVVIAGFESVDVMESILHIVRQKVSHEAKLENTYARFVTHKGNTKAQALVAQYLHPVDTFRWRGLGLIAKSALGLKEAYAHLDAQKIYASHFDPTPQEDHKLCLCGSILKGMAKPPQCKLFGTLCTPTNPLGSCMVSSEGACHAYFHYQGVL